MIRMSTKDQKKKTTNRIIIKDRIIDPRLHFDNLIVIYGAI